MITMHAAIPMANPNILIAEKALFFQRFRQAILKYSFMAQLYGILGYFTFFMFCWEKKFSSIG